MLEEDYKGVLSKLPLRQDFLAEEGVRPRDWQPRRTRYKVPLRLMRLCLLGVMLPAAFVAVPIYMRYQVYSEQLYPLAISDQRLIDGKMSTIWCQGQVIKANATFNAYLMGDVPTMQEEIVPVSMTRHLVLEDDMKEYWGFYLLRGSSVTVSTCVRWPGASLAVVRGHKNLHECAFIGDDSSEELEELVEVAEDRGLLTRPNDSNTSGPSNEPSRMKRVHQGVEFHQRDGKASGSAVTYQHQHHQQLTSHELDAKDMRAILTQIFMKQLNMKKRLKGKPQHHLEGVYKESANIDKPPSFDDTEFLRQELLALKIESSAAPTDAPKRQLENDISTLDTSFTTETSTQAISQRPPDQNIVSSDLLILNISTTHDPSSLEVFEETLRKISALGNRGKKVLNKLIEEIDHQTLETEERIRKAIKDIIDKEERRQKRDLFLSSPFGAGLADDDEDGNAAIEEDILNPDGIADDRGTVNEATLNDRSNSEFWSSFSSSEERLLECKGLILNLPLTPHHFCESKHEEHHSTASVANTITYRVPINGYYFFVFSSENEIQPNYLRVKFELLKAMYNTTNSIFQCKNRTSECFLPMSFFSKERTVLELPVTGNDSQWNQEYVVISICEPRTAVYLVFTLAVPLLILAFAFY